MKEYKEYNLLFKRVGLTGLASLITSLSAIILLPLLTRNLSIYEYGIWVQIGVTVALISNITILGMPSSNIRFIAALNKREEIQEIFYSTSMMVVFAVLVTSIFYYLFADQISSLLFNKDILVTKIIPFIVLMTCLNSMNVNFLRAYHQIKLYNLFSIVLVLFEMGIVYFFVIYGYGIFGATVGLLISQTLVFLMTFIIIALKIGIKFPQFKNIKKYLSYGMPSITTNFYSWVVKLSDRYVIGILLGMAYVGFYSPSYTLSSVILMFSAPLSAILFPTLSKHYDENKVETVQKMLKYSMKYFLALSIPTAFGLSVLSPQILILLSTKEIALNSYFVTPFVALSSILYGAYGIISQIIFFSNKTKLLVVIWPVAGLINVLLNILLIPYIGIAGAAISTMITYLVAFSITFYYSFKSFRFDIDLKFIFKCIFASALMSVVIVGINPNGLFEVLTVITGSTLLYVTLMYLIKAFSPEEFDFMKSLLKNFAFEFKSMLNSLRIGLF